MIFFAQNRDFSHEISPKFSRLATLCAIILNAPPNLNHWIRPWSLIFYLLQYHAIGGGMYIFIFMFSLYISL